MGVKFIRAVGKVGLALLPFYACPLFAAAISVTRVESMLKTQTPFTVVKQLRHGNQGQDWRDVINQVMTGDPAWLAVALSLEKGVRKQGAYDLLDAVTRAIPENPAGVLHILNEKNYFLNESNVCHLPLIPATPYADSKVIRNAFNAVKKLPEGKSCSEIMQRAISGSHAPLTEQD